MLGTDVAARRRGRWLVAALAAALIAMTVVAAPADAKQDKVDICHATGNGSYLLISVAASAEQTHRDNHGDGAIGDTVPGSEGFVFDAACVPVRNWLVRAYSTDAAGNRIVISELIDTNGDGVPSGGDTVNTYQYPRNFDGTSYGTFGVTTFAVNANANPNGDIVVAQTLGFDQIPYCPCEFLWVGVEFLDAYVEFGNGGLGGDSLWIDSKLAGQSDRIRVSADSPSRPGDNLTATKDSNGDDSFLDIEFNL